MCESKTSDGASSLHTPFASSKVPNEWIGNWPCTEQWFWKDVAAFCYGWWSDMENIGGLGI